MLSHWSRPGAHWQAWGLFPDSVRQGTSQARRALGEDIFDYYARPENAGEAALFASSMADLSAMTVQGPWPRSTPADAGYYALAV